MSVFLFSTVVFELAIFVGFFRHRCCSMIYGASYVAWRSHLFTLMTCCMIFSSSLLKISSVSISLRKIHQELHQFKNYPKQNNIPRKNCTFFRSFSCKLIKQYIYWLSLWNKFIRNQITKIDKKQRRLWIALVPGRFFLASW